MKKMLLTFFTIAAMTSISSAQPWANATLDINSVAAMANSNGDLFWDYTNAQFKVPKGSPNSTSTIAAAALWVGGLDTGGQLHIGAQTYRQSGNDFYPGPVMNTSSYSLANDALWNKVWKINKSTIDSFRLNLFTTIPASIATWPGNGDVAQGQAAQLADYVDTDNNGIYDPAAGDYPCIKGDQALYMIFNDDRNVHTETGGRKLKFEFHAMLYAYKAPGTWLDTVVFLNYKMLNRSGITLTDGYIGSWTDFDIGYFGDDYIGCDVGRNIFYGYNGDANDGSSAQATTGTFGANPPAQGVVYLRGPAANPNDGIDNNRNGTIDEPGEVCLMNKFTYYNNDFSLMGNPQTAWDYYKYMSGRWIDSTRFKYGGDGFNTAGPACDFVFPGVSDPQGWGTNMQPQSPWDEATVGNSPGDRRGFASSGPFVIMPGQQMCMDFAYVFGRGASGPASGIAAMQNAADSATAFYGTTSPCSCVTYPLAVNEAAQDLHIQFYPNPATNNITVLWNPKTANARMDIYDVNGKIVSSEIISKSSTVVSMEKFATGIYFIRINDGKYTGTAKVLKQ
jgi:hypothetical protein